MNGPFPVTREMGYSCSDIVDKRMVGYVGVPKGQITFFFDYNTCIYRSMYYCMEIVLCRLTVIPL